MSEQNSLFSISCNTCAVRLKVFSESAIGQVLACPRCGSMVLVEPPEGWVAPVRQAGVPGPKQSRDPDDSQATLSGEFDDLRDAATATQPAQRRRSVAPASVTPPLHSDGPILPDGSWDSTTAREKSKAMAWIASISALCLMALVAIIYLVTSIAGPSNEAQMAQSSPGAAPGVSPANGDTDPPNEIGRPANTDTAAMNGAGQPVADDQPNPAGQPGDTAAPSTADSEPAPGPGQTENVAGAPGNSVSDSGSRPDSWPGSDSPPEPGEADQPLVEIANDLERPAGPLLLEQADSGTTMMDDVGPMADLFADPGPVNLEAIRDIAADSPDKLIGIGKVYVPRPDSLDVDFERQLAETFPGVSYQDIPLVELLRNLNVLSGIPIQLDSHSVRYGHIDPVAPVSFRGTDQSVIEIINTAVAGLNLVALPFPDERVIVVTDQQQRAFSQHQIDLDEALVGDGQHAEELIALIHQVTGPELWNSGGGTARIEISGSQALLDADGWLADEVKQILEKLGAAARLNSGEADPEAGAIVQSLWSASRETLDSPCSFAVNQLDSMHRILNQVYHSDGLVITVDWRTLLPEKWTPATQMPWPSNNLTVAETLRDITSSMELAHRLVAPNVVEICSRQSYWDAPRIEVYPCRQQLQTFTAEQVMGYLQANVAADIRPTGARKRVEFVPRFNCIIARLPDPLQLRVEKTLEQLNRQ